MIFNHVDEYKKHLCNAMIFFIHAAAKISLDDRINTHWWHIVVIKYQGRPQLKCNQKHEQSHITFMRVF